MTSGATTFSTEDVDEVGVPAALQALVRAAGDMSARARSVATACSDTWTVSMVGSDVDSMVIEARDASLLAWQLDGGVLVLRCRYAVAVAHSTRTASTHSCASRRSATTGADECAAAVTGVLHVLRSVTTALAFIEAPLG